jgi:hypothetical protein
MAYDLRLLLDCQTAAQAELLCRLLGRDSRPVFADDLPPEQQPLFELVEDIEFPEEVEVQGASLWIQWMEVRDFEISDFEPVLSMSGARIQIAFMVPDDPMSGDDDDDEDDPLDGWFYVMDQDELSRVDPRTLQEQYPAEVIARFAPYLPLGE